MKINQDFAMSIETILYLNKKKSNDYVQAGLIAQTLDFSVGYLQKVIQMLSKHGIVECKRGRIGGVRLRARTITLLDLWEATCGRLELAEPSLAIMKKPMKAFADSLRSTVIYKVK